MKVSAINLSHINFSGYRHVKDARGNKNYEFNFPFDENNYDCYLEIFDISKDTRGNFYVNDIIPNIDSDNGMFKLKNGVNKVNLKMDYFLDEDTPFAYHYKLIKKGTNAPIYRVDAGDIIDNKSKGAHEIYNYVIPTESQLSHGGSMKLIIPDNYNVGYHYNPILFNKEDSIIKDKDIPAQKSFKHFSNKMGGTLAGVEKSLDNGDFDGYSSIISLPIFTDDSLSAHGYWNKNCMQMIPTLGNINNYASLQRKMFAKGINFVSDGAFVNEGLEGIHFANVLKWGEESPYYNWFKASGLQNGPFLLGVFGKNQDFVSHKLVNSPYKYNQDKDGNIKISKNHEYDKYKPTYVQIFDTRLVSEKQKSDNNNLIKSYDILSTNNPYEINTHNDTVINYHFEIDPEIYNSNVKKLNEYNNSHSEKLMLNSIDGTRFVNKFENFELEDKIESNFETWDANTDIAKLNYVYSHSDTETGKNLTSRERMQRNYALKRGNIEVQDYIISSGAYWTKKTNDILTMHIAQNLGQSKDAYKIIQDKIQEGVFPKKLMDNITPEIVQNVYSGKYFVQKPDIKFEELVKKSMMDFPLDSIEFGDNIAGVLSSSYITKRAAVEDEIGKSRYDLKSNNFADELYKNELYNLTVSILKNVEEKTGQSFLSGDISSDFAKYTLPIIVPEIVKFLVIKSLKPDITTYVDKNTGEIGYDYDKLKATSLQSLSIYGASPEDEAFTLIKKIKSGLHNLSEKDKHILEDAIVKSLEKTNAVSFKLAEVIMDKSDAGLDWRIDATKDIADIDSLRDGKNDFAYTWQEVTNFWKKFNSKILSINPNAYMVAEVTDEGGLHSIGNGYNSRFESNNIIKKFINETGMTATANYSNFFTDIILMFGKNFEYDKNRMEFPVDNYLQKRIFEKMIGNDDYLRTSNLNSLLYSYTFISNHDKPRPLHCFALDMNMFFADLTDPNNHQYRERAYRILEDNFFSKVTSKNLNSYDFSRVSPKAIAMAETMRTGFVETLNKLAENNDYFKVKHDEIFIAISKSIKDLASGSYLDKNFNADAFAVKPFDVTIDAILTQAKSKYGLNLANEDLYKNEILKCILDPAFSRLLGAMKYLVALPGKPTLFAGDDLGATGYEEKTKNIYLQNRGYIHNEWKKEKPFIKDYYKKLNDVMALRSRPELEALNNGAIFTLPLQTATNGTKVSAILRQNTSGKMAISLFNTSGIQHNNNEKYTPHSIRLASIMLRGEGEKIGLSGGLQENMKFVNANNSNDVYYVHRYDNDYYIEHDDKSPIYIDDSTMILYSTNL